MATVRRFLVLCAAALAGCSSFSPNPMDWFGSKDTGPKMAALPALDIDGQARAGLTCDIGADECGLAQGPAELSMRETAPLLSIRDA